MVIYQDMQGGGWPTFTAGFIQFRNIVGIVVQTCPPQNYPCRCLKLQISSATEKHFFAARWVSTHLSSSTHDAALVV